ncbi:MAG: hypothetical protein AAF628_33705 [Planctomycetota bacterium]
MAERAKVYVAIQKHYELDTFVWLGGAGHTESGEEFEWLDGKVAGAPWHAAAEFPIPHDRPVHVLGHPLEDGPSMSYLDGNTEHRGRGIGFIVCYSQD